MPKIENVITYLEEFQGDYIPVERSFEYAKLANSYLNKSHTSSNGYKLIINILNNWKKIPRSTQELWTDIIEIAGFYPYLEKNKESLIFNNLSGEIRKELHLSKYMASKYFHDEQLELLNLLNGDKNIIVSAPTSFGKSLLIEEVIASTKYKNIVVIQPTLALLDETRHKLQKYRDKYKLIVRTSQKPDDVKGNVFLFTAERVNEYKFFPPIEFLVIDEFYKLSGKRDDERSASLNNAFYHLLEKYNPKFYLLGPNIDDISHGFADKYNAVFHKSNYSLVDTKEINLYHQYSNEFGVSGKKKNFKELILFDLLLSLKDEQTIIYCSSPSRVRYLAKKFTSFLIEKQTEKTRINFPIIEWIEKNISKEWSLTKNLQYEIGIHDGALQKHITTSIIDYFNKKLIKYLFCTSTIIEGVNTSAKNIVYFDSKKGGRSSVDYFDYSNIKGRAGRMMEHYIGRIYNFNPPPKRENIIIDIPFFQQNPLKDETLIHLKDVHVLDKKSTQYKRIYDIPSKEKEIIKLNGVSVQGQKNILSILRRDIKTKYSLMNWSNYPEYEQLKYILSLAWNNLIQEGETTSPMTSKRLVYMTFNYGIYKNIHKLISDIFQYDLERKKDNETDADIYDNAIQKGFQIIKHWFQYKVPKWLSVINSLQEFVCLENNIKPGNYLLYANTLENDFIAENLVILLEYGIPTSAIRTLEKIIPASINQDDILNYIKEKSLYKDARLLMYEKEKILDNI